MKCSIGIEKQRQLRRKIAKNLITVVQEGQPFNLKEYMRSIYTMVHNATDDHALAIDAARLTPFFVNQIIGTDLELMSGLIKAGLDFGSLGELLVDAKDLSSGPKAIETYLGLNQNIIEELKELNEQTAEEVVEQTFPTEEVPIVGEAATPFTRGYSFEGIKDKPNLKFRAYAPTALADRIQEALDYEETSEKYNVPDESQAFYFSVKRQIVKLLQTPGVDYDSSKIDFPGLRGGVYLTAMRATDISIENSRPGEDPSKRDKGVILALTDRYGQLIEFNPQTSLPTITGGKIAYYYLRQTDRVIDAEGNVSLQPEDYNAIKALADSIKVGRKATDKELAEAKTIYERQLQLISDIRNHVLSNEGYEGRIRMKINGGTMGHTNFDFEKINTPLNAINFDGQVFKPFQAGEKQSELIPGAYYFKLDSMYDQPIEIERPSVAESGYGEMLTSLFVDDLVYEDAAGNMVTADLQTRRDFINPYVYTDKSFKVVENGVLIMGTKYPTVTPEQKEIARKAVMTYLTELSPKRVIEKRDIGTGKTIIKSTEPDYKSKYKLGAILEVVDQNAGPSTYYVIEKKKLHINEALLSAGTYNAVTVSKQADGSSKVEITKGAPYKNYILDKFSIHYELNAEKKLVKLNSYFTFEPLQEELDKMYKTAEQSEEVDKAIKSSVSPSSLDSAGPADTTLDDLLNETWNDDSLNKSIDQKEFNKPATVKQIEAAREWYGKSPLSKSVPFETMFDAINTSDPNAVARWSLAGITLFKGSDYSDLYHEAWHAFTQTFMTKEQRKELYNEARNKSGSFVDYQGDRVQFEKASDLQLEEYLAEDFRSYMLSGEQSKVDGPARNKFFRWLVDFLKALFGKSTVTEITQDERSNKVIKTLYEKLRVGNLNEYSFAQTNADFGALNKGIQPFGKSFDEPINYEDSMSIVETVDSLLSEYIDRSNAGLTEQDKVKLGQLEERAKRADISRSERTDIEIQISSLKAKQTYKYTSRALKTSQGRQRAYRYVQIRMSQIHNSMVDELNTIPESDTIKRARLSKSIEKLNYAIRHFGDVKNMEKNKPEDGNINGVIAYHTFKSRLLEPADVDVIFVEDKQDEVDPFLAGREGYDRGGNETSMKELAKAEIITLLHSLHQEEVNEFGVPKLVKFQEVWNRLARMLENQITPENMEAVMKRESVDYPPLKQLLAKLGPLKTGSKAETDLWTNFWQAFNLTRIPLIQMTVDKIQKEGKAAKYISKIGEASADYRRVGWMWDSEFKTDFNNPYALVDNDLGGIYLNLDKVLDDFSAADVQKKQWEFFNAIGFRLSNKAEIKQALSSQDIGGAKYYRQRLVYLKARGIQVRQLDDINREYPEIVDPKTKEVLFTAKADQNWRFRQLQELETRYSDRHSNFMVTNAAGNTQFEHSLNNSLTVMVNNINMARSYQELIAMPFMSHLDMNRNPFMKASVWLNSLFILDESLKGTAEYGLKRKASTKEDAPTVKLELKNLSGVLLTEDGNATGDGIESAKADEFSKLILDFHLEVQGASPELMRHADKSTSFSVSLNRKFTGGKSTKQYIENDDFFGTLGHSQAVDILIPHISAELERVNLMRKMKADKVTDFDFGYLDRGQKFVAFDDVLSSETKDMLYGLTETLIEFDRGKSEQAVALRKAIAQDMQVYFDNQVQAVTALLNKSDFISNTVYDKTIGDAAHVRGEVSQSQAKEALIKSFVYNSWIHNLESMLVLYGDLALFKDFHKRNAGAGSTGKIYRTDEVMQEYINTSVKREFTITQGFESKSYDGSFSVAIGKDNLIPSSYYEEYLEAIGDKKAAKAYAQNKDAEGMNEGDAQGWITFDAYRILKTAEGDWTPAHETLYQRIVKGEDIRPTETNIFFATQKVQYFGPLKSTGLPITALHKFSLFPLIPTVIRGTNLERLHTKMMKEGVDYALFESGSKVGTITKSGEKDSFYNENRTFNAEQPFTKNDIYLEFLKDQLEIEPKFKKKVIFSTQLRKLIEDGLMENGVPTDFKPGKSFTERTKGWEALSEKSKRATSNRYDLLKRYESNIFALTEVKKKQLLKKANWEMDEKGNVTGKMDDLIKFVKSQLSVQDLGDHEIDFLAVKGNDIKHDISMSLSADKIERLLNALVTKELVKQKVNGEGLIQVSGALFESVESTNRSYTNPTEEDIKKYGTNDLPSYHKKADGKTAAMKVKIALQGDFVKLLGAAHLDGEPIYTLARLNEMVRNEEWLNKDDHRQMITMVGTRIPTQGLNSMEFMEVYEFLPTEAGNIIVPPAEIVAKSGSDFDIDKLTVMMPNLKKVKQGVQIKKVYQADTQEAQDLYTAYKKARVEIELLKDSEGNKIDRRKLARVRVEKESTEEDQSTTDYIRIEEDTYLYDQMLEKIFGFSMQEAEQELEAILLEEGDLLTYEQFLESVNGSKAVENELIWNIKSILELPENYSNLIRPNGVDILMPIVEEMVVAGVQDYNPKKRVFGKTGEKASPTRVLEIPHNLYVHSSNNIGKKVLGQIAVGNTYNAVFNRVGAYMNPSAGITTARYNELRQKPENKLTFSEIKELRSYQKQELFLPHHQVPVGNEKGISLSHLMDVNNENRISDVINQLINGAVDVAKDPWLFDIQGNVEIMPSLMFMIEAGVPVRTAIYMVSLPIVREYVKEQRLAKSTFAGPLDKAPDNPNFFQSKARGAILTNPVFGFNILPEQVAGREIAATIQTEGEKQIKSYLKENTTFSDEALKKGVQEGLKDSALQRAAFMHFLQIENMSKGLRDIKLKMNLDTTKSGTLFEAQNRILMIDGLRQDARFPSTLIDNILNESPIGAFYVQPFQLKIWNKLFALRNHPMLNDFLHTKFKEGIMSDMANTYSDTETFANEFRNDLLNFIFQNSTGSFNINTIKAYKGAEVASEIPVEEVKSLTFGAFVKDDVLYVDKGQLYTDFKKGAYNTVDYTKKGLARVNTEAFKTAKDYYRFVFERETLRSVLPYDSVKDSLEFKQKHSTVASLMEQGKDESKADLKNRIDAMSYEVFLRDKALDNVNNVWKIFKSTDTYADQFNIIRKSYPSLSTDFAIMKQLSVSSKNGVTNLKLNDTALEGDTVNLFHENLLDLANDKVKKVEDPVDNKRISDFFARFATVAFLQSGQNTKSMFSMVRIVPQEHYLRMMEEPVKAYTNHFNKAMDVNLTPPILDEFYTQFIAANQISNRSVRIRTKNYSSEMTLNRSSDMMKKGETHPKILPADSLPPFVTPIGTAPLYEAASITRDRAAAMLQDDSKVLVFNTVSGNKTGGAAFMDNLLFEVDSTNKFGFPTRIQFNNVKEAQYKDLDGDIDPEVKLRIDEAIESLKEQRDKYGKELVFSDRGYGQYMIGANDQTNVVDNPNPPAPKTFLYLSKRLYQEFNYLNPNYLKTGTGRAEIQSTQFISDQMVRDLMKICK